MHLQVVHDVDGGCGHGIGPAPAKGRDGADGGRCLGEAGVGEDDAALRVVALLWY